VRNDVFHGALLILMRVLSLALMSCELSVEPFAWVAEKHVQEMVFLCDFAKVILDALPQGSAASSSLPAHYANETFVRMLPIKDLAGMVMAAGAAGGDGDEAGTRGTAALSIASLCKSTTDQSTVVTNVWLRKNLTRLSTGLRMLVSNDLNPSKALATIEKERSEAIVAWGRANGMERVSMFNDVLFFL
jgi:hypothetical protein